MLFPYLMGNRNFTCPAHPQLLGPAVMPIKPVTVEPPEHPLHALTTYELTYYRHRHRVAPADVGHQSRLRAPNPGSVIKGKVSIHGYRRPRGLPGSGDGSRIGSPGLGSARGWTDRDGYGRFSRAWRGDLEGDAGRPGDDDAAGEAGEARPAYRQPDRVPRSCEESLA